MNIQELIGDYEAKVAVINEGLQRAGIDREELTMLDHLCFRTESLDEFRCVMGDFALLGRSLGEVDVAGRPIGVIALDEPLEAGGWRIPFLEVAAPKEGSPYPSGLEHAEFVTLRLLDDFEKAHADLDFKRDAMDRPVNPELKYRPGDISVKFHQLSLGSAIMIENALALAKNTPSEL